MSKTPITISYEICLYNLSDGDASEDELQKFAEDFSTYIKKICTEEIFSTYDKDKYKIVFDIEIRGYSECGELEIDCVDYDLQLMLRDDLPTSSDLWEGFCKEQQGRV